MALARRLLTAAGVGGAFAWIGSPPDTAWTRYGTVLEPTVGWEATSIQEPDVRYESGTFRMWAKSGWATTGLGVYTSSDGITWTAYAGNPVLGAGGSSWAPELSQPMILWDGSQYRCYFNSGGDSDPNTPRYATSADGLAWTVGGSGTFITNPGSITQWGNRHFWQEDGGWYGLQEARSSARWRMFYATSSDGYSWTIGNSGAALSTLELSASHNVGGPTLWRADLGPRYRLWFHSGTGATSNLYYSESADAITWDTPSLVLTHTGAGDEIDQIADPSIVTVGADAFMWYAGVDNTGETGVIRLATGTATP